MRLERCDFLVRVVIEHAELKVVRTCDEPVFARDELDATHRDVGYLKCLHQGARLVVIDVYRAIVEACEQPWLGGVKVGAFDAVRARE